MGVVGVAIIAFLAAADPQVYQQQVEDDWLFQESYHVGKPAKPADTSSDAAGGCDGVKNGRWGFHTTFEENPWWQVDLGAVRKVDRCVFWNRCDAADRMKLFDLMFSEDGSAWRTVYQYDGPVFLGFTDQKPLDVKIEAQSARYVRVQYPGKMYLHLDEVEVFGPDDPAKNLALHQPAGQSSISQWSDNHLPFTQVSLQERARDVLAHCSKLAAALTAAGGDGVAYAPAIAGLTGAVANAADDEAAKQVFLEARRLQRRLLFADPLLNFDAMLFAKRVPGSYNHMSDQYYGWWSRPGGGLFIMRNWKSGAPELECISAALPDQGSFMRPSLSFDGSRVLFAWCKHYPDLAAQPDKLNKANVPEDAFYHMFEMNVDGSGLRQITHGKYDDFDARYLPGGRIVFLSTRRGQFIQCGPESAALTLAKNDLPDVYVRCGGGPERPVAVYTLHTMNADGTNLCAISPFEMFEWTPSVGADGTVLYSRWDYIDRYNMPYMSLWSIHPDGTQSRLVYGNFTVAPHCTFEPQFIPNSHKVIFTASGHHAQTMGSLVLLDPAVGTEGPTPITRLTPEVCFPEIEGWPASFYSSPWPLSEHLYLVAWGAQTAVVQGQQRAKNDLGIYLFDADGQLELLYRDSDLACEWPLPLRSRPEPPVIPPMTKPDGPKEGRFILSDVYRGLKSVQPGDIKALRIVAVPAKTHPVMHFPEMGLTRDDPGKCVLGTVPVNPDGSAYFRLPAGVTVFLQALDARGVAVQTMRSATHVQAGQTLSCIGCHEHRQMAPPQKRVTAALEEPAKITPGPPGSWPLRFDQLVQPVLDQHCVRCHNPQAEDETAAKFDLTAKNAYDALTKYGKPSLAENVATAYALGSSVEGTGPATTSPLLAKITDPKGHHEIKLDPLSLECIITWLDTYGQRLGSFSPEQEQQLTQFKSDMADLLTTRGG